MCEWRSKKGKSNFEVVSYFDGGLWYFSVLLMMDSTQKFIDDSLKERPIGETEHFTWYITDIGIVSLFKKNEKLEIYSTNVDMEANKIALDITKEEKEYLEIKDKRLFLFYS